MPDKYVRGSQTNQAELHTGYKKGEKKTNLNDFAQTSVQKHFVTTEPVLRIFVVR